MPFSDDDFGRVVNGWFENADALLLGRTTYGLFAGFWPDVTDPTWKNTTVIRGDVVAAVTALKPQPGRELQVHGSCGLVHTLHDAELVDEYQRLHAEPLDRPLITTEGEER